jgi:hypothetical protein
MAEVTNAKAAVFNLFNIGSALLNAMTLCQLVKAIDNLNGKFGIGGMPTNSSENCNANFPHTACLKLIKKIFCL